MDGRGWCCFNNVRDEIPKKGDLELSADIFLKDTSCLNIKPYRFSMTISKYNDIFHEQQNLAFPNCTYVCTSVSQYAASGVFNCFVYCLSKVNVNVTRSSNALDGLEQNTTLF